MGRFVLITGLRILLILVVITICYAYFYSGPFDIISSERDWIGIFGEIGKSLGIVAILALIYNISQKRKDDLSKSTPYLRITNALIVEIDDLEALRGEENSFIFEGNNNETTQSLYSRFTEAIDQEGKHYLRIEIENKSYSHEAIAKNVQLSFEIVFSSDADFEGSSNTFVKKFTLPNIGVGIDPDSKAEILINLTPIDELRLQYIFCKGEVTSVSCLNTNNEKIGSRRAKFDKFIIPSDRVVSEETEQRMRTA